MQQMLVGRSTARIGSSFSVRLEAAWNCQAEIATIFYCKVEMGAHHSQQKNQITEIGFPKKLMVWFFELVISNIKSIGKLKMANTYAAILESWVLHLSVTHRIPEWGKALGI